MPPALQKTRLTIDSRIRIAGALADHAFEPARKRLKAEEAGLFKACMVDAFSAATLRRIAKLPPDWFPWSDHQTFLTGGWNVPLAGAKLRRPYEWPDRQIKSAELAERVRVHALAMKEHREQRDRLALELRSVLLAVGTVEKAIELMPAMAKQIAAVVSPAPAPVPGTALVTHAAAVVQRIEKMRSAA